GLRGLQPVAGVAGDRRVGDCPHGVARIAQPLRLSRDVRSLPRSFCHARGHHARLRWIARSSREGAFAMTTFDPPRPVVRRLVEEALAEDFGVLGDITSLACIGEDQTAIAAFVAREEGVLAGTAFATEVCRQIEHAVDIKWSVRDGESIDAGTELGRVSGSLRALLAGERTALNFLQFSSGVASLTRRYVRAARGKARIFDTRKTTPVLRAAQRAAVLAGGGFNHRDSLSDE